MRPRRARAHGDVRGSPPCPRVQPRALCNTSTVLRGRIEVLSAGSVPQRLATLLLQLADRFGDTGDDGVVRIPVALSRGALARLVSARVETVIRTASEWQKRSLMGSDGGGFRTLRRPYAAAHRRRGLTPPRAERSRGRLVASGHVGTQRVFGGGVAVARPGPRAREPPHTRRKGACAALAAERVGVAQALEERVIADTAARSSARTLPARSGRNPLAIRN